MLQLLIGRAAFISAVVAVLSTSAAKAGDPAFQRFLQDMRQEAQTLGVSAATFDAATRGLEPDLSLPDLVVPGRPETPPRGQPEFVQTPAEYLKEATIDRLASQGRKLAEEHRAPLARIGQAFGVPPEIIMAIWGRETAFGQYKLPHNAIRVLATQAFAGKRKEQFRHEFLLALRMIEEGHAKPADMRSSWAGAMGHTQFLPSDFYNYAVDFDGDGRRDIWRSVPDALASAAKQLVDKGWERGSQWGYEVRLPRAIDCSMAEPDVTMPIAEWIAHGFVPAHDRRLTEGELTKRASVVLPAGIYGPGFLAPKNYFVLKAYNFSDLYVLFVGHLADRLGAAQSFATPWRPLAQLPSAHIEELQRRLSAAGYYRDKIDGKAGMKTRSALGAYQKAHGLKLDCWPDPAVLAHLRRTTAER